MTNAKLVRRLASFVFMVAALSPIAAFGQPETDCSTCPQPATDCSECPGPPNTAADAMAKGNLTYLDDTGGCEEESLQCVAADPMEVWKVKPKNAHKPKWARWSTRTNPPASQRYFWEIAHKGTGTNYLGPDLPAAITIGCTGNQWATTTKAAGNIDPGGPTLDWEYRVTVYECTEDNQKGDCLCQSDPIIEIHD